MRFKLRNALIAAVLYLWAFSIVWGFASFIGKSAMFIFVLYVLACMYIAKWMIDDARSRTSQDNTVEFYKSSALAVFGEAWKSFHYLFEYKEDVTQSIITRMANDLQVKLGCTDLKETVFKDIDRDLPQPEARGFRLSLAPNSARRTRFHFLCGVSRTLNVQGLRWWVLVLGERDPNKVFWRFALAPLTMPFVILAYLRREFEPLHGLTSVDPGFFNSVDTLSRTREMEFVAYESFISTLESFGIDTSDLRAQRANILSINVGGGGNLSIGSMIQGAYNRVSGATSGGSGGGPH